MSARTLMRHRCTIQRNIAAPNSWNNPGTPGWDQHITDQPCHAWFNSGRTLTPAGEEVSVLDIRLLLPKGTDVLDTDRIENVLDRRGNVVMAGPLIIDAIGPRKDHIALTLTEAP